MGLNDITLDNLASTYTTVVFTLTANLLDIKALFKRVLL